VKKTETTVKVVKNRSLQQPPVHGKKNRSSSCKLQLSYTHPPAISFYEQQVCQTLSLRIAEHYFIVVGVAANVAHDAALATADLK
jgi:hypothetical protein